MRFKGYKFGVRWIAENDEPLEDDPIVMSGYASVALLADLTDKSSRKVAKDVVAKRRILRLIG